MIRALFRYLAEIGQDIKSIFTSTNTWVILPMVVLLLAAQGVVIWVGLKMDFVLNFSHGGVRCFVPNQNTKMLTTMFAGMFFVVAAIYGIGETINLLDKRARAERIPPGQLFGAVGSLAVATLIALGSALYIASWC